MGRRILVVDRQTLLAELVREQFADNDAEITLASSTDEALAILENDSYDLVIADIQTSAMSAVPLARRIHGEFPQIGIVLVTSFLEMESPADVLQAGASDYITKPVQADELAVVIRRSLRRLDFDRAHSTLPAKPSFNLGFEGIIGNSRALMQSLDIAARAAPTNATVLIQGETGTGKELLARAVHLNSQRRENPFVTIDCGAIPPALLESELFGHVKGSFTGAIANKQGSLEAAHTGSLFLDEIGEMPMDLQVKLLRVLQNGEIQRVGSTSSHTVDLRVIVATHRDLHSMVKAGTFRQDLFYRLSVIPLVIPPLRNRSEDIAELVYHFLEKAKVRNRRESLIFPDTLMPYFLRYHWPGNVRELENLMERLVVLARTSEVRIADLPDYIRSEHPPTSLLDRSFSPEGVSLEGVERELLLKALENFAGNQTRAAKYLHISRKTLMYRMAKHGIHRARADSRGKRTA
jgi:two-component system NtrC family response regulator